MSNRVVVENNALTIPVPPPVAGTNTGNAVTEANQTMASALDKKLKEIGESLDAATQCSFGRACTSEDGEKQNQPNIGKDLSDADKVELGGTGSGTPGGWGPEDEENERNSDPHSSTSGRDLNSELVGEEIANGHAFDKHVIEQSELKS